MPHRKLRIVSQSRSAFAPPHAPIGCIIGADRPVSAEENLRLLSAFGRVDDIDRRAWLLELVEHFAGLGKSAH